MQRNEVLMLYDIARQCKQQQRAQPWHLPCQQCLGQCASDALLHCRQQTPNASSQLWQSSGGYRRYSPRCWQRQQARRAQPVALQEGPAKKVICGWSRGAEAGAIFCQQAAGCCILEEALGAAWGWFLWAPAPAPERVGGSRWAINVDVINHVINILFNYIYNQCVYVYNLWYNMLYNNTI